MSDQSPEDLPPRPSDQAPIPWKVKAGFRLRLRMEPSARSELVGADPGQFEVLEAGDEFNVTDTRSVAESPSGGQSQMYLRVERSGTFCGWAFVYHPSSLKSRAPVEVCHQVSRRPSAAASTAAVTDVDSYGAAGRGNGGSETDAGAAGLPSAEALAQLIREREPTRGWASHLALDSSAEPTTDGSATSASSSEAPVPDAAVATPGSLTAASRSLGGGEMESTPPERPLSTSLAPSPTRSATSELRSTGGFPGSIAGDSPSGEFVSTIARLTKPPPKLTSTGGGGGAGVGGRAVSAPKPRSSEQPRTWVPPRAYNEDGSPRADRFGLRSGASLALNQTADSSADAPSVRNPYYSPYFSKPPGGDSSNSSSSSSGSGNGGTSTSSSNSVMGSKPLLAANDVIPSAPPSSRFSNTTSSSSGNSSSNSSTPLRRSAENALRATPSTAAAAAPDSSYNTAASNETPAVRLAYLSSASSALRAPNSGSSGGHNSAFASSSSVPSSQHGGSSPAVSQAGSAAGSQAGSHATSPARSSGAASDSASRGNSGGSASPMSSAAAARLLEVQAKLEGFYSTEGLSGNQNTHPNTGSNSSSNSGSESLGASFKGTSFAHLPPPLPPRSRVASDAPTLLRGSGTTVENPNIGSSSSDEAAANDSLFSPDAHYRFSFPWDHRTSPADRAGPRGAPPTPLPDRVTGPPPLQLPQQQQGVTFEDSKVEPATNSGEPMKFSAAKAGDVVLTDGDYESGYETAYPRSDGGYETAAGGDSDYPGDRSFDDDDADEGYATAAASDGDYASAGQHLRERHHQRRTPRELDAGKKGVERQLGSGEVKSRIRSGNKTYENASSPQPPLPSSVEAPTSSRRLQFVGMLLASSGDNVLGDSATAAGPAASPEGGGSENPVGGLSPLNSPLYLPGGSTTSSPPLSTSSVTTPANANTGSHFPFPDSSAQSSSHLPGPVASTTITTSGAEEDAQERAAAAIAAAEHAAAQKRVAEADARARAAAALATAEREQLARQEQAAARAQAERLQAKEEAARVAAAEAARERAAAAEAQARAQEQVAQAKARKKEEEEERARVQAVAEKQKAEEAAAAAVAAAEAARIAKVAKEEEKAAQQALAATAERQLPPPSLAGFRFQELLGQGGFSQTYRAVVEASSTSVAVKVVDRRQLRPHDELAFVREVACLLRCSAHPGVLSLFEDYQDPYNGGSVGSGVVSELQRHYLVTELLGGGDLFDRVVSRGKYPEPEALAVARQLASVLKHLRDLGVVHRDLKPENVLLESFSDHVTIRLADFGFAARFDDPEEAKDLATLRFGTVEYMAPELLPPEPPSYGPPGDVWALGVVVYVLLCGHPPFFESDTTEDDDASTTAAGAAGGAPNGQVDPNTAPARVVAAVRAGAYSFDLPSWQGVSASAKAWVGSALTVKASQRPSAASLLQHPWIMAAQRVPNHPRGRWELDLAVNESTAPAASHASPVEASVAPLTSEPAGSAAAAAAATLPEVASKVITPLASPAPSHDNKSVASGGMSASKSASGRSSRIVEFSRTKPIGLTLAPGSLLVQAVGAGDQADKLGVTVGSLVVAVNGQPCKSVRDMMKHRALDPLVLKMTLQEPSGEALDLDQSLVWEAKKSPGIGGGQDAHLPVPPPESETESVKSSGSSSSSSSSTASSKHAASVDVPSTYAAAILSARHTPDKGRKKGSSSDSGSSSSGSSSAQHSPARSSLNAALEAVADPPPNGGEILPVATAEAPMPPSSTNTTVALPSSTVTTTAAAMAPTSAPLPISVDALAWVELTVFLMELSLAKFDAPLQERFCAAVASAAGVWPDVSRVRLAGVRAGSVVVDCRVGGFPQLADAQVAKQKLVKAARSVFDAKVFGAYIVTAILTKQQKQQKQQQQQQQPSLPFSAGTTAAAPTSGRAPAAEPEELPAEPTRVAPPPPPSSSVATGDHSPPVMGRQSSTDTFGNEHSDVSSDSLGSHSDSNPRTDEEVDEDHASDPKTNQGHAGGDTTKNLPAKANAAPTATSPLRTSSLDGRALAAVKRAYAIATTSATSAASSPLQPGEKAQPADDQKHQGSSPGDDAWAKEPFGGGASDDNAVQSRRDAQHYGLSLVEDSSTTPLKPPPSPPASPKGTTTAAQGVQTQQESQATLESSLGSPASSPTKQTPSKASIAAASPTPPSPPVARRFAPSSSSSAAAAVLRGENEDGSALPEQHEGDSESLAAGVSLAGAVIAKNGTKLASPEQRESTQTPPLPPPLTKETEDGMEALSNQVDDARRSSREGEVEEGKVDEGAERYDKDKEGEEEEVAEPDSPGRAQRIQLAVGRALMAVQDLVKEADEAMRDPEMESAEEAREVALLLYQEAIETVLGVRQVAPELFFDGSELMSLAETLLHQAEALPGGSSSGGGNNNDNVNDSESDSSHDDSRSSPSPADAKRIAANVSPDGGDRSRSTDEAIDRVGQRARSLSPRPRSVSPSNHNNDSSGGSGNSGRGPNELATFTSSSAAQQQPPRTPSPRPARRRGASGSARGRSPSPGAVEGAAALASVFADETPPGSPIFRPSPARGSSGNNDNNSEGAEAEESPTYAKPFLRGRRQQDDDDEEDDDYPRYDEENSLEASWGEGLLSGDGSDFLAGSLDDSSDASQSPSSSPSPKKVVLKKIRRRGGNKSNSKSIDDSDEAEDKHGEGEDEEGDESEDLEFYAGAGVPEESDLAHELRMFYDLHTIPEAEDSSVDEDDDDDDDDDAEIGRAQHGYGSGAAAVNSSEGLRSTGSSSRSPSARSLSSEALSGGGGGVDSAAAAVALASAAMHLADSADVLRSREFRSADLLLAEASEAPGSARGSYDSDEYAERLGLGMPASPLVVPLASNHHNTNLGASINAGPPAMVLPLVTPPKREKPEKKKKKKKSTKAPPGSPTPPSPTDEEANDVSQPEVAPQFSAASEITAQDTVAAASVGESAFTDPHTNDESPTRRPFKSSFVQALVASSSAWVLAAPAVSPPRAAPAVATSKASERNAEDHNDADNDAPVSPISPRTFARTAVSLDDSDHARSPGPTQEEVELDGSSSHHSDASPKVSHPTTQASPSASPSSSKPQPPSPTPFVPISESNSPVHASQPRTASSAQGQVHGSPPKLRPRPPSAVSGRGRGKGQDAGSGGGAMSGRGNGGRGGSGGSASSSGSPSKTGRPTSPLAVAMMAALARRADKTAAAAASSSSSPGAAASAEGPGEGGNDSSGSGVSAQNSWENVGSAFGADDSIESLKHSRDGDEDEDEGDEEEEVNESEVRLASADDEDLDEVQEDDKGDQEASEAANQSVEDESGETTGEATASVAELRRAEEEVAAEAAAAEKARIDALLETLSGGNVEVAVYLQGSAESPFYAAGCSATTPLAALLHGAAHHFALGSDPPPPGWAQHPSTELRWAPSSLLRKRHHHSGSSGSSGQQAPSSQQQVQVRGALPAEWTTVGDVVHANDHDQDNAGEHGANSSSSSSSPLPTPSSITSAGSKRPCEGGGAAGGLASWEVYQDHDSFPGETAATKPFVTFEAAAKLCLKHGYGGFTVLQHEACFKRPARSEVKEKRLRSKGAVLYVAPPAPKRRLSSAGLKRLSSSGKMSSDNLLGNSSNSNSSSSPQPASPKQQPPTTVVLVAAPYLPPPTAVAKLSVGKKDVSKVSVAVSPEFDAPPLAADDPARAMGFLLSPEVRKGPGGRSGKHSNNGHLQGSIAAAADSSPPQKQRTTGAAAVSPQSPSDSLHNGGPVHRRFLSWTWRCPEGLELGFSAFFHPTPSLSAKSSMAQSIVAPYMRATSGEGEWCLASEGTVVFEFDNSDAAFKGRAIEYAIATHDL